MDMIYRHYKSENLVYKDGDIFEDDQVCRCFMVIALFLLWNSDNYLTYTGRTFLASRSFMCGYKLFFFYSKMKN